MLVKEYKVNLLDFLNKQHDAMNGRIVRAAMQGIVLREHISGAAMLKTLAKVVSAQLDQDDMSFEDATKEALRLDYENQFPPAE